MSTITSGRLRILLVEPSPTLRHELAATLLTHLDANLSCMETGSDALATDMVAVHDAAVISLGVEDMSALELIRQLQQLSRRPIVLTAPVVSVDQLASAMRLKVCDLFTVPIDHMAVVVRLRAELLHRQRERRRHRRWLRMRDLVRKMLKERGELQERMDVLCRDLVGAHQRLARRVANAGAKRL